jgi:hypothetical protein
MSVPTDRRGIRRNPNGNVNGRLALPRSGVGRDQAPGRCGDPAQAELRRDPLASFPTGHLMPGERGYARNSCQLVGEIRLRSSPGPSRTGKPRTYCFVARHAMPPRIDQFTGCNKLATADGSLDSCRATSRAILYFLFLILFFTFVFIFYLLSFLLVLYFSLPFLL